PVLHAGRAPRLPREPSRRPRRAVELMRVLATGGAGYVGSHCVRALRRAGHEVTIRDDRWRGHRELAGRAGATLRVSDFSDLAATEKVLKEGWDAVVHFAALAL